MIAEHGRVQRKARKHQDEQADACETQSWMRQAMEEPAERCAFQRPANSDPLAVELDWKNQRDEKQRRAAEKRELRITRRAVERRALEKHEKSKKRRQRKCRGHQTDDAAWMRGVNELIHQVKVQRSGERRGCPQRRFTREFPMKNKRKHAEHCIKRQVPNQRQRSARRIEMLKMPGMFERQHRNQSH